MDDTHTGSCLCGAVRFKTRGPLRGVIYCHCSQCRKQSGHFYAATNVPEGNITMSGAESITWYEASSFAKRG
ncbi:MAG: GFA family protein, partial [Mesorhizobium sp.]